MAQSKSRPQREPCINKCPQSTMAWRKVVKQNGPPKKSYSKQSLQVTALHCHTFSQNCKESCESLSYNWRCIWAKLGYEIHDRPLLCLFFDVAGNQKKMLVTEAKLNKSLKLLFHKEASESPQCFFVFSESRSVLCPSKRYSLTCYPNDQNWIRAPVCCL